MRRLKMGRGKMGLILAMVLALLAGEGCKKNDTSKYSTPTARVYKSPGLENSPYFDVDFKDFGNNKDASFAVESDPNGGFNIFVGIEYSVRVKEYMTNKGIDEMISEGKIQSGHIRQFRLHSDAASLDTNIAALLDQARSYVSSPDYQADLAKRLKPDVKQQGTTTITTEYELVK
jgi:hypothetical protein